MEADPSGVGLSGMDGPTLTGQTSGSVPLQELLNMQGEAANLVLSQRVPHASWR